MKRCFLFICLLAVLPFLSGAAKNAWDIWREGYETYQKGEAARDRGEYSKAAELFQKSLGLYREIQRQRPDWDQSIIQKRIADSERELSSVRQLLGIADVPVDDAPKPTPQGAAPAGVDFVDQESRKRELEIYRKKIVDLTVENDQLRKEAERLKTNEVDALKLLKEQRVLRENLTLLEQQNRTLEKQLQEPETRVEALHKQMVEGQLAFDLLSKRFQLAEARAQKLDGEITELNLQKTKAETELKTSATEVTRLSRELEELRNFRDAAVKQRTAQEAAVKEAELKLKNLTTKLATQTEEVVVLNRRLAAAAVAGGGTDKLNAELLTENAKFKAEAAAARKALDASAEELLALQNKHRAAQLEVVQQKEVLLRIETLRLALEKGNATLTKELERERASAELSSVELKTLRERNAKLEEDMKSWSERCARLEKQLKTQNTAATAGIAQSEEENLKQAKELKSLKDQLKTQDEELKVLTTQSASRGKALEAANAELAQSQAALLLAEDKLKKTQETETGLAEAQARLAKLEPELERFRNDVPAMRKELAAGQQVAEELKVAQTSLDTAKKRLAELEKLSSRLVEEQKNNQALSEKNRALAETLAKLQEDSAKPRPSAPQPTVPEPLLPGAPADTTPLTDRKPADLIAAGRKEEAAERWDVAIWNYDAALAQEPENKEAAIRLGALVLRRGEFARAEVLLSKAARRSPNDAVLAALYAEALTGLDKYGNALSVLEKPLSLNPNDFRLRLVQAKALAGSGRKDAAMQGFQTAAKLNPSAPEPNLEMARLVLADGKEKEAADYYRQARDLGAKPDSELEPKLGKLLAEHRELAEFMSTAAAEAARNEDWTSALWYYRQLNEIDRGNARIPLRMAYSHIQTENYAQALEILTLNPPSTEGDILRIVTFLKQNDFAAARAAAEDALKRNGGKPLEWSDDWPELKATFVELRKNPELNQSVAGMECEKVFGKLFLE